MQGRQRRAIHRGAVCVVLCLTDDDSVGEEVVDHVVHQHHVHHSVHVCVHAKVPVNRVTNHRSDKSGDTVQDQDENVHTSRGLPT